MRGIFCYEMERSDTTPILKVSLEIISTARTHQISKKLFLSVLGKKFRIKKAQDLQQHLTMTSTIRLTIISID